MVAESLRAAELLEEKGVSVRMVNLHTVKPLDKECLLAAAQETKCVVTVEEHTILGGMGSAVAEVLLEMSKERIVFRRLGLRDKFPDGYGSYEYMKKRNGLSWDQIAGEVLRAVERKEKISRRMLV
jgi:transketolase